MDARLFIDPDTMAIDVALSGGGLATDGGLETAVVVSLFTDARAQSDDVLADDQLDDDANRRGWWGDAVPPTIDGVPKVGDRIGSRLWLLGREKIVPETISRAETYIREALQWMIDDGMARRIDVTVEAQRQNVLAFEIVIERPSGESAKCAFMWDAQAQKGEQL